MKAVILVGGEGTRLRPLTYDVPKPMVPIVNKPYMEHQVDTLRRHGFDEIIFALGYKSEAFEAYFGDGSRFGVRFWHVVENEPLGTAGAVKNVESLLDDTFLVFNGDVLSGIDLTALVNLHRAKGAVGTLALTPVEDPSQYGVVVTEADGRVRSFIEKPPRESAPTNAINAGVYVLEPSVVAAMPAGQRWMFEHQVFPTLLSEGKPLYASLSDAYWLDIGSPSRYLQASHDTLEGRAGVVLPPPTHQRVWLGSGAAIEPGAHVEGAVWIGEGSIIGSSATVIGPTVIGARCTVEPGATVTGSTIWDGTVIEAGARLDRALIGRDCVVGASSFIEAEAVVGSRERLERGARVAAGQKVPA